MKLKNSLPLLILLFPMYAQTLQPPKSLDTVRAKSNSSTDKKNLSKFQETLNSDKINYSSSTDLKNLVKQNFNGIDFFQNSLQFNGLGTDANRILYDGIPLIGEDKKSMSFELLDYFFLDSVSLLRGSSSAIYGSGATAGAINLIPNTPLQDNQTTLKTDLFYSIQNKFNSKAVAAQKKDKIQWKTALSYQLDDGYTEKKGSYKKRIIPPYQQVNALADVVYDVTEDDRLHFGLLNGYRVSDHPSDISSGFVSVLDTDNIFTTVGYQRNFNDKNLLKTHLSYQNYMMFKSTYVDGGRQLNEDDVVGTNGHQIYHNGGFHLENTTTFMPWLFFIVSNDFNVNGTDNTLLDMVASEKKTTAFTQVRYEIAPSLQLLFDFDKRYIFSVTARNTYHSTFGYNISPDVSFKYNYNNLVIFTIDYGRSFITPSFRDNYYKWLHPVPVRFLVKGNPHLKPETSDNVNGTLAYNPLPWLGFDGELFFYRFYNKISQQNDIDTTASGEINGWHYIGTVNTVNKFGYIRTGLNFKVRGQIVSNIFSYYVGYSYVYAVEKEKEKDKYSPSMFIAPHKVSIGFDFNVPVSKTKLGISSFWTDRRKYIITDSSSKTEKMTDYFVDLSFSVIQPIYQYFFLYTKVENALNRKDTNFLTDEGINVTFGFMFMTDNLLRTNSEIQNRQLNW